MSVDTDLATLRRATRFSNSQESLSLAWECKDALARVETELSRLREQLDEAMELSGDRRKWAEAAEARCARLQQALERIAGNERWVQAGPLVDAAREALAGPDTPAAKNDAERVEAMLRHTRPVAPDRFADTPADSQPEECLGGCPGRCTCIPPRQPEEPT